MTTTETWGPCETGQLNDLRGTLVRADRQQRLARTATIGGAVAAVLAIVVSTALLGGAPGGAMISCESCMAQFDAYQAHLVEEAAMAADDVAQVEQHLAACDKCRSHFEQRFPGVLPIGLTAALPLLFLTTRSRARRR